MVRTNYALVYLWVEGSLRHWPNWCSLKTTTSFPASSVLVLSWFFCFLPDIPNRLIKTNQLWKGKFHKGNLTAFLLTVEMLVQQFCFVSAVGLLTVVAIEIICYAMQHLLLLFTNCIDSFCWKSSDGLLILLVGNSLPPPSDAWRSSQQLPALDSNIVAIHCSSCYKHVTMNTPVG